MTTCELDPTTRPYRPYGAGERILYEKAPEVVLVGPAGTGKSRANLEKLHIVAEKYAGCRILMIRKTRVSLAQSAQVTFEEKVLPANHSLIERELSRVNRMSYVYPNGSEIVLGGMDKATRILSTEYDLAYVQEATELEESDWEMITGRLRYGVLPYQQIIGDCNPDKPTHWLRQRMNSGRTLELLSRHEDNPVYWDHAAGDWTPAGRAYVMGTLANLTGARRGRYFLGLWVSAEGTIYEEVWDASVNVIPRDAITIPKHYNKLAGRWESSWPHYWVVDFGYTNPFVWQLWVEDPDGRLYRVKEIYHTRRLVEDHCARILELTEDDPAPAVILCDHDAEDRATFERKIGRKTQAAHKSVSDGIQAVAARLRKAGDGRPRLFYLQDSVDEIDPILVEKKAPTCTEQEFDGYVWDTRNGQKKGEEPLKKDDHGLDATRYIVAETDLKGNQWRIY